MHDTVTGQWPPIDSLANRSSNSVCPVIGILARLRLGLGKH